MARHGPSLQFGTADLQGHAAHVAVILTCRVDLLNKLFWLHLPSEAQFYGLPSEHLGGAN